MKKKFLLSSKIFFFILLSIVYTNFLNENNIHIVDGHNEVLYKWLEVASNHRNIKPLKLLHFDSRKLIINFFRCRFNFAKVLIKKIY
jgi:hypothetical protein